MGNRLESASANLTCQLQNPGVVGNRSVFVFSSTKKMRENVFERHESIFYHCFQIYEENCGLMNSFAGAEKMKACETQMACFGCSRRRNLL